MKIDTNLLNTIKDYAGKVMNTKTFLDYAEVMANNMDAHKKVKAENISFASESKNLKSAYALLNVTIIVMETLLIERTNTFDGIGNAQSFRNAVSVLNKFLHLSNIIDFVEQKPEAFFGLSPSVEKISSVNEPRPTTARTFFKSKTFAFVLSLLQKIAYETSETVYGYIENHTTDSEEMIGWMDECKMYITDWKRWLINPENGFDTDELMDFDVLLGSVKIFMTAKMISLIEG